MIAPRNNADKRETGRIQGLDTMRALAAFWVFVFHFGVSCDRSNLGNGFGMAFCGPAAVIVFFIISGFCIHYPYRNGRPRPSTLVFWIRRYARIGIPLLAGLFLAPYFKLSSHGLIAIAGWSILVELWLYTVYPFLRLPGKSRWLWMELLLLAFAFGWGVVLWRRPTDYGSWGHLFNWALALPCWLLGVWWAETFDAQGRRCPSRRRLWVLRALTWGASAVCAGLHSRNVIHYPWSLNLFALLAAVWLKNEVEHACAGHVWRFGEWMGKWSYSLYLMHGLVLTWVQELLKEKSGLPPGLHVALGVSLTFLASYGFYLLVEFPSHRVARQLANGLSQIGAYGRAKIDSMGKGCVTRGGGVP